MVGLITANYHTITGETVGETLTFGTNDLEFATLQAIAVTGFKVIKQSRNFTVLGDRDKRMVIGYG